MSSDEEYLSDPMSETGYDDDTDPEEVELGMDDDFDDDGNFGSEKIDKPEKKAFEVDHKPLSEEELRKIQKAQIEEIHTISMLPFEQCAILLRFFKWQKERLIEKYMDDSDRVLDAAGLGSEYAKPLTLEKTPGFMCDICCDDEADKSFAMACRHRYCANCYRQYLESKIKDEGVAIAIQCPAEGCTRVVDSKAVKLLVSASIYERYGELLNRTYVDDKPNLVWCPAPDCGYAVECDVRKTELNKVVPTVTCANPQHRFCFGCSLADHQPCPCQLVKKWLKKCEDDSETANWISAHTKECPKCVSTIEKNGGCNHMTCRKCKHEFCWVCMGPWSEHGTAWYNCNRYEEKSGHDARDGQAKSRASLERYLHYYNRYANHEQSAKLDKDLYLKTEKKMTLLQSSSGMSWIDVQYLKGASDALQQCRQTLKWTYAFAFYLERNNLTFIFEDNQRDLELAVEQLSELFEKNAEDLAGLRGEILNKTAYVDRRRIILLDDTAKGLKEESWKFNVELK